MQVAQLHIAPLHSTLTFLSGIMFHAKMRQTCTDLNTVLNTLGLESHMAPAKRQYADQGVSQDFKSGRPK